MSEETPAAEAHAVAEETSSSLGGNTRITRLTVPSDPSYIYPLSAFPPLSAFDESIQHAALIIPARRTAELRNQLSDAIMHRPKIKSVYPHESDPSRRILVLKNNDDSIYEDRFVAAAMKEDETIEKCKFKVTLSYKDWTVEEVLRKLLPPFDEIPSAFEIAGHVAHVNLREELLPFKHLIGKVILDKNGPRIKTVVNKVGSIETEFRTFGMEILAGYSGDNWSTVNVKEDGCQYTLDFQHVYWNSRLGGEHRRLVRTIQKDAKKLGKKLVVADVMAGVGPFAVPLAKPPSEIEVHANDLNPTSYKYLQINGTQNKCRNLHTYNMDGRAFLHKLDKEGIQYDHVIMNLPATAPEFLNAFWGFPFEKLPRIHVHCFGGKEYGAEQQSIDRCAKALKCTLDVSDDNVSVHVVRDVSPKKNMMCVSFTLPEQVRHIPRLDLSSASAEEEPDAKRIKT